MPKHQDIHIEQSYAASPRIRREPWRSLTILVSKLIFYGMLGTALFCLALFPNFVHSLFALPVVGVLVTALYSLSSCYFWFKGWLSVVEYRHEDQVAQARAAADPQPIVLRKFLWLLYPWWLERWLQPVPIIIRPAPASSPQQEGAVTRELACPIATIRLQLWSTFRLVLVGANGTQVELTLERREPRYMALLALLAVARDGDLVPLATILTSLYRGLATPGNSFGHDRHRILDYINDAALRGGLCPLDDLFVSERRGVEQEVCYGLNPLWEVEFLTLLRECEAQIAQAQANPGAFRSEEVRQLCKQLDHSYDEGLLTAQWETSPFQLKRDPVWRWIKEPFGRHCTRVTAVLQAAAQLEVAAAEGQPDEDGAARLKQAARYYEQGMSILLTGLPDEEQAEKFLTSSLELSQQIQDERSAERVQRKYKRLTE